MFLKSLSLRQFRNYSSLDITLSPRLNLFQGPNGSGKSNLLEAVSLLATGQSHRGAETKSFPQKDRTEFALEAVFDGEETVSVQIRQKKGQARQVFLNGRLQRRLRDWIGRAPLVSFSPDDLALVKGDPAFRRRALNEILIQVDPAYAEALQRYTKVLQERNAALRQIQEEGRDLAHLDPWDGALVKDGLFLSETRRDFLEIFSPHVGTFHGRLASSREKAELAYKPSFRLTGSGEADAAENRARLRELRDAEVALGSSLIGPHRDELELTIDGAPAKAYASQGQQRTLILAVKLAEFEYLSDRLRRRPLCLLDDMLSELDPDRRSNVASSLMVEAQCLVSLTSDADWPEGRSYRESPSTRIFDVRNGGVRA
jgi:DNA replication and repair protein RecF